MDHIGSSLIVALIGFLGVVIGARITAKYNQKQSNKQLLISTYCEVLEAHKRWVGEPTQKTLAELIVAIEKARLLCPRDTDPYLMLFQSRVMLNHPNSPEQTSMAVTVLMEKARHDIENA